MTDEDFAKLNDLFDSKLDHTIDRLTAVLASKKDVQNLRGDVEGLRETVQATAVNVDKLTGIKEDFRMEKAATDGQLDRHEGWIKQLAAKTDTRLEY